MNWILFQNSLLVACGTTLAATALGILAALFVAGLPRSGRMLAFVFGVIALALPPFLVTNSWLHFLGQTGVWRGLVHFNISSFTGTIWILSLLLWPITMFLVLGAWQRLEAPQLESDTAVRGWPLVSRVLLPLGQGAVAQSAMLTFVLAFNNFSVPALLQVKTFPSEVWIRFSTNFDSAGAARLSVPMIVTSLLVMFIFAKRNVPWPHVQTTLCSALFRRQLGPAFFAAGAVTSILLFFLSSVLPLAQILSTRRTWTELPGALAAGQAAIWNSFWVPAAAACITVALSAATACGSFRRSQSGIVVKAADTLFWLPFFMPGVLLGIVLIALFNHGWSAFFYQSAGILILALTIRYFALGWNALRHACVIADAELVDAARLEGASSWGVFKHAYWPQISSQAAAGGYIVFLLCLWDVESIILIMPPRIGETLALRIFNLLHYGHNAQVNALCLALLAVALGPLCLWLGAKALRGMFAGFERAAAATILGTSLLLVCGCGQKSTGSLNSGIFDDVKIIGSRGVGVGQLNKPRSVAVDAQDNVYVVDMTGRVQKFSSNGIYQLSWQMPETDLGKPKGMCRDRQGNIVVVEPHYSRVNHFTPGGQLGLQWGNRGTNDGQLSVPRAVGLDSKNEIFVTEYLERERVQKFSMSDILAGSGPKWLLSFGKPGNGPGEFNRPEGLCVDSRDQVYVADSCNHRVQVFSSEGKLLRTYGKPGKGLGELSYPYDICVDAEGRQYVCEFGNSRIQVFNAKDQPIEIIGERGSEPGQFSNPWGVALDSAGNLYVADSQNHRVQKLIRRPQAQVAVALQQHTDRTDWSAGAMSCALKPGWNGLGSP